MADIRLMPVVAAALVDPAGDVLLQRRPVDKHHCGLWEFPGGKLEPGETPEAALTRELAEELAIAIDPAAVEPVAFASVPAGAGPDGTARHLLLLLYCVRRWSGTPRALAADALAWVRLAQLSSRPMPPADIPLVAALHRYLTGTTDATG